ncbi:hypothetical protein MKI79_07290 [Acinetobacter sp. A3.8]|uniref:Uncharacterized protein n=1 Tax=Acinetobacter sedimenti TaxID=2919922 RepID=A0A9X1WY22_9GAMM|nr:hypothetical protein [Acinetobacter sedimenti]MCJ8146703.1 hypothetical protein [Acinetobacter sedimenti]
MLFIPANVTHQLVEGSYLSIYIAPYHPLARRLNALLNEPTNITQIPPPIQQQLTQSFIANASLDQIIFQFLDLLDVPSRPQLSNKLQHILELLFTGVLQSNIPNRQYLAQVAGLSESRFSHWFREQNRITFAKLSKMVAPCVDLSKCNKDRF